MNIQPKCSCSGNTDLMFSCSGAADIAEIGDRAVRTLHKAGDAKMFCLAGIAGKVELIEVNTRGADPILVVDGCDSDCAKKTMEFGGFTDFIHLRVSDHGTEAAGLRSAEAQRDRQASRRALVLPSVTTANDGR
jgi:uncharacterized metal-binding protein